MVVGKAGGSEAVGMLIGMLIAGGGLIDGGEGSGWGGGSSDAVGGVAEGGVDGVARGARGVE